MKKFKAGKMRPWFTSLVSLFACSAFAAELPTITLGAEDDWFPYCANIKNQTIGLGPDLVSAAFLEMGYQVHFVSYPLSRCFSEVRKGALVGCLESIRDKTIEHDYLWHKQALYQSSLKIYTQASNPVKKVSVKELEGHVVGITNAYEYGVEFDGNTKIKKDMARTDLQNLEKLKLGRIEYFPIYDRVYQYNMAVHPQFKGQFKEVGNLFLVDLFIPFSKVHPDSTKTIEILNGGMEKILFNGKYQEISDKWHSPKHFSQFVK